MTDVPDITLDAGMPANVDAEKTILGAILLDNEAFVEAAGKLEVDDFSLDSHRRIFLRMANLVETYTAIDIVTLSHQLNKHKEVEAIGGIAYLASLTEGLPRRPVIAEYVRIVKDKALLRKIMMICSSSIARAADQAEDAVGVGMATLSLLEACVSTQLQASTESAHDFLERTFPTSQDMIEHPAKSIGVMSGFKEFDDLTCGFQKGDLIILAARPSMGKAQPISEPVLLQDGTWRAMGLLKTGDLLASVDGCRSSVIAVHERGEREVFEVTFSDGRSTKVCADHLWKVRYRDWPICRPVDTSTLAKMLTKTRNQKRLSIDIIDGSFGESAPPLDPYVLGVLLGDGGLTYRTPIITSADPEIVAEVRKRLGNSVSIRKVSGKYGYSIRQSRISGCRKTPGSRGRAKNDIWVTNLLKELGLMGVGSEAKFIPRIYFQCSRETRLDLLRGLLDTDGWAEKGGTVRFCSSSKQLAKDVQELVRSLGGLCSIKEKKTRFLPSFVCKIRHFCAEHMFHLSRKSVRAKRKHHTVRLSVTRVEPSGRDVTRCITVSHPSCLYITRDYIATHNSSLAWNIAEHVSVNCETPMMYLPLETGKKNLFNRGVCSRARIPYQAFRKGTLSDAMQADFRDAYEEIKRSPLHVDDKANTIPAIRIQALKLKSQQQLFMVLIDQLNFIETPTEARRRNVSREQEVAGYTRSLKNLAKELDVPIIVIHHISRAVTKRTDNRPTLADLRESGAIEQDADVVTFIHRPEYYDRTDEALKGKAELIIAKQREGPTETCNVVFDPSILRFTDPFDPADLQTDIDYWSRV